MADDATRISAASTLHSVEDLLSAGLIAAEDAPELDKVAARYAVSITPEVLALIDRSDPADPIARQFVPDGRELDHGPQELADPIGDATHSPVEGVIHRYPDRLLLKLLSVCPVYCRFCFRRESVGPGAQQVLSAQALEGALGYIAGNPSVWEVILTGGDPLMLSPRRMEAVMRRLGEIAHVKIVRLHTRVPVVDPGRVTAEMIGALKSGGKTVYVALHANHPREMNAQTAQACALFVDAGIPMVSQTVLLRGVNDDAQTLMRLMRLFIENRIKPYYLHHADLAPGTAHLRTDIEAGRRIMRALRGRLSGLALPEYVIDIPGGHGKSPAGPAYVERIGGCDYVIEDWRAARHAYATAGEAVVSSRATKS